MATAVRPQPGIDVRGGMQGVNEPQAPASPETQAMARGEATRPFMPGFMAGVTSVPSTLAGAFRGISDMVPNPRDEVVDKNGPLTGLSKLQAQIGAAPELGAKGYISGVESTEAKNEAGMNLNPLAYILGKGVQQAPLAAASAASAPATLGSRIAFNALTGGALGAAENGRNPMMGGLRGAAMGAGGELVASAPGALGTGLLKRGGASSAARYGPKIGRIVEEATAGGGSVPFAGVEKELRALQAPLSGGIIPGEQNVGNELEQIIGLIKKNKTVDLGGVATPGGYGDVTPDLAMTPMQLHDTKGALARNAGFHRARQTMGQETMGRASGIAKGAEEAAIAQGAPDRLNEFLDAKSIYGPALASAEKAQAARELPLLGKTGAPDFTTLFGGAVGGVPGAAAGAVGRRLAPTLLNKGAFGAGMAMRGFSYPAAPAARAASVSPALVQWLMNNQNKGQ